ncbi:MAG TPA: UDP-N-acetylmuramoyl-L-alanyl-D-glutamate--2,6-diaminopimelate ligase [Patescibacteria group bacterium]
MWQKTKNVYHLLIALLANTWFSFPGKKLTVIGITGTDGKTTTVNLIYHILHEAGLPVSVISTVGATIHGKTLPLGFHVTTPSSIKLIKFLRQAVNSLHAEKQNYLVLEVTSHSLDQHRVWGIPFTIGGITNVTHEHLDYHKTYENYVKTKAKLLQRAKTAIVNVDDKSFALLKPLLANKKYITYGIKNKADITPKTFSFTSSLPGEYNKYNILLAVAVCKQLGIDDAKIKNAIATYIPPLGRTEIVYNKDFTVMIDFAHTPNAFSQLLPAIKQQVKGRLIHVFGSAGLRDIQKRPLMGEASAKYADIIVLTAEDPRSENVVKIMSQIEKGIDENRKKDIQIIKVPRREKAIDAAIALAKKGDFVLLTGKAHEKSMNYGHGEEPWSEHEAVKRALENK